MEMEVAIRELILGKSSTFVSNEWSFQIMDGQRFCGVEDEDRGKVIFSSFQILVTLMLSDALSTLFWFNVQKGSKGADFLII